MDKRSSTVRRSIKRAGVPVLIVILLCGACIFYLESFYRADERAVASYPASGSISERTTDGGDIVFDPGNAETGLIFYPGGKVDHTAYIPLMREIAGEGVLCVLCEMPFRLAVLDMHAADDKWDCFSSVKHWYIGGHSLGGVMAASELSKHRGRYEGLILLGAFSSENISDEPVRVLSIYGSEDGVLDRDKYSAAKSNLPADSREIVIAGGCHAGFGLYGPQKGDGEPAISSVEQIRICAREITAWINEGDRE